MNIDSIKQVMIRAPNWVGDAVMAVPALRELRRIFAGSHITLVARAWVAGLLEEEALADEVVSIGNARGTIQKISRFIYDARLLRTMGFDLAVLLQNSFGAALLAKAAGARAIAGYPTDARRSLLNLTIPLDADYKSVHQVFYYLKIAGWLEQEIKGQSRVELDYAQPRLQVDEKKKELGLRTLGEYGVRLDRPVAVINPGATNSRAKRWLAARFAETADRLAQLDGFQTIIIGAPGDEEAAIATASHMKTPAIALAGQTTISELKGVLACSTLVISNDTGAAHLSAALGIPTVVVFGPTDHVSTRPLSDLAAVVRRDVHCSPCMLRDCPIDHRCMTGVQVDDVYRAAHRLLASAT